MKRNILIALVIALSLVTISCSNNNQVKNETSIKETMIEESSIQEQKENANQNVNQNHEGQGGRPSGGMGGPDKSGDAVLQGLIQTEVPKFKQFSYIDKQSNITIEYNLFIPKNYDPSKKYPMVQFIPDASLFGKGTEASLKQGYGALVWTTDEAQAKNECFVYVPAFNQGLKNDYPSLNVRMDSTVDDDYNVSEDVFVNIDCIKDICNKYSIDTDRIYTTGQSMGGILSFFYAAYFNDVFAAYMPVGSQFDNSIAQYLTDSTIGNDNIIYLVSEGDTKASAGMNELIDNLGGDETKYSFRKFSIKDSLENQNKIVNEAIAEGKNLNLFMFNKGEVVPEGIQSNNEHMYSFDYAYKIDAAREYLFTKTKNSRRSKPLEYTITGISNIDEGANYDEAYISLLKATILGEKKAPRYIGYMYENGLGVNQSDIQASIFYHIGAMREDITSYYYLGLMYLDGKGVVKNEDRAKYYFKLAAESGNDSATGVKEAKEKLKSITLSEIENKTIDPSIFLDYKKGIEEKVYKWIKSEDGKYYTFAYIDENGNTVLSNEAKINVGANNNESIDNGEGKMPQGDKPQGDRPQGDRPEEGMPGGMMEMMMKNAKVSQGVYINANITNLENQTMLIYAPAEYFNVDEDGNVVSINYENEKNGYNAKTAPIVFLNECGGWRSSSPRSCETSYIDEGFVYVTCGARSRDAMSSDGTLHTGKAPMQMADLKSGVIELRANDEVIPGDKNKIISIGTSGGGQMSSIFGASGDMKEYYPYMYEAGTLGVSKNEDGTYTSAFKDSIYAAQNYCPIADIENADMAYAWWWVDLVDDGGVYNGKITDFEKRLQELEADEYVKYLNSLNLKDKDGNDLTLTGLRSGTYYDAILNNLSDALNKYVAAGMEFTIDEEANKNWLTKDENGKYKITDLKGFMMGTGLVNNRNKAIPGFDAKDKSAENNAFGKADVDTVHFSKSIATILKDNYEELSKLDGFDKEQVDAYIEDCISGEDAELINNQTALLNATHILLGIDGLKAVNPVKHFRNRSGTADQHTSFGIGYNILTAAAMKGIDIDYSLVWNMQHGSNEGESTGTFIDWVNKISK